MASVPSKFQRSLRIISLPLARVNPRLHQSSPSIDPNLTYYHFKLDDPGKTRKEGMVRWITTKTADFWASLGREKEGSWKRKLHRHGERLVDRIDFEELALKSVDPSLGPRVSGQDTDGEHCEKENAPRATIPLIYPPSIISNSSLSTDSRSTHPSLAHLQCLLADRTPLHRKRFYTWAILAPFTAPLAIVPLVPNLPFFFCAWRSWSHYRAYRASQYLQRVISDGAIVPCASTELDNVYADALSKESSTVNPEGLGPGQELLLTRDSIPRIVAMFDLPPSAGADILRAMEQARARVKKVAAQ